MQQPYESYMRLALDEAKKAYDMGEVPIGAVIVNAGGDVVARGHNRRECDHDATAHAEMIAIRETCEKLGRWRLTDCTLFVTIEPCPMCAGAIVMSRLDRVIYGGTDAKAGACESIFNIPGHPALNHTPEITAGILADECAALMKDFFRARRKKKRSEFDKDLTRHYTML